MRALRSLTVLVAMVASTGPGSPAAAQSASPGPSGVPVAASGEPAPSADADADPELGASASIPPGWLLTTILERSAGRDAITVVATAPGGEQRTVARLDDVTRAVDGAPAPRRVLQVQPVTVEGMLPIVFETADAAGEGRAIHVHDLFAADPGTPVVDLQAGGERWFPLEAATSGPDGRISWTDDDPHGDGTVLLDPVTGRLAVLPPPRGRSVVRDDAWLASGDGWPASSESGTGIVTTVGTFRPTSPPLPLVDLARGGRQVSRAGKALATWDTPASATDRSGKRPCRTWWTATDDPSVRPTEIWWSRCTDRGRLLDIRWDVDGAGVLGLLVRDGRLELIRRDEPGLSTVLASVRDDRLASVLQGATGVEVLGLAPGPRPFELLLAFRPLDRTDGAFFLSTTDAALHEAPGGFAGFTAVPLDATTATDPG